MRGVTVSAVAASAAGKFLEDAWGHVGDAQHGAAWVMDGATGLGDRNYINGAYSDASWYAAEFSKLLAQYSLQQNSPQEIFAAVIQAMADVWAAQTKQKQLPRYVLPSAAGIWMRWRNGELETVSLGDCRGWHIADDGQSTQLGLLDEDPNDAWLAEMIAEHQRSGVNAEDMRGAVMEILRTARSRMNSDGGYHIFSIHPETAQHMHVQKMKLWAGHIVLCSDGLFRWSDVLRQGNAKEFAQSCIRDLHGTLTHVRELENCDADCKRYTRLKRHDDATGIVLHVE